MILLYSHHWKVIKAGVSLPVGEGGGGGGQQDGQHDAGNTGNNHLERKSVKKHARLGVAVTLCCLASYPGNTQCKRCALVKYHLWFLCILGSVVVAPGKGPSFVRNWFFNKKRII